MKQESFKFSGRASNPATKKFSPAQIAAQKLFAERARAGTLGKTVKRKANPDKANKEMQQYTVFHRGTSNIAGTVRETSPKAAKEKIANRLGLPTLTYLVARKTNPDKAKPRAYVKRASQATGAPPSKRLVTRRKKALTAPAGYFPNPKAAAATQYTVFRAEVRGNQRTATRLADFDSLKTAKEYANAYANKYNVSTLITPRKT